MTLWSGDRWAGSNSFARDGIREIKLTDTEHYQITRDFLNRHERMLEILLTEEELDLKSKER